MTNRPTSHKEVGLLALLETTMSPMTELDVINEMLGTLGESPLNDVDEDHPLVAAALRKFRLTNYKEQARKWWFNTEIVTLTPDPVSKFIYVPADTINVDPRSSRDPLVQRGRRFYDPNNATYEITGNVQCMLIRLVPFEDLPATAQAFVSASAKLAFQADFDGDQVKYRQLMDDKRDAYSILNSEHIRNCQTNLLHRAAGQDFLRNHVNHHLPTFR